MLLGLIPGFWFFYWYTQKYYLSINNNGYSDQLTSNWLGRFPEGFFGIWLSPSKGILVYSPVFIFIFVGLYLIWRTKKFQKNYDYLVFFGLVIVHTLVLGKWKHWYGGYGFGYRMAADVIPFLVLLLVPYLKSTLFKKTVKWFYAAIVFSIFVQLFGIVFFDGIWHAAYDTGFVNTGWLWSLQDSEFAFNVRRILVKLGYLRQACPKCAPIDF